MKATSFKETNQVLGAGGNPDTDQLPVAISKAPGLCPYNVVISKWKLTDEELQKINETGELWMVIMGSNQPPIMPTVYNPFTEHGYRPYNYCK